MLITASFFLAFRAISARSFAWLGSIPALLLFLFIFTDRTEVRPEIFSFLIFSAYIWLLFRAKYIRTDRLLWALPVLQLFWVNLHIYFFIGPLLYAIFCLDRAIAKKITRPMIWVGAAIVLATLANPNFLTGALYPLHVFNEYGYNVAENKSPFFLEKFGPSTAITLFKISLWVVVLNFLLVIKSWRSKVFEILTAAFLVYAGVKMQRNFSIYALGLLPIVAINFIEGVQRLPWFPRSISARVKIIRSAISATLIGLLLLMIFNVLSGRYYDGNESRLSFGLHIPKGAQGAVDFLEENGISGPMFNNFDVGSFLAWKLYPKERVFVDGRPEAYPVKFFQEVYIPMQENADTWAAKAKEYNINYVIFDHRDQTPWASTFLKRMTTNSDWPIVFVDDRTIIFLKNDQANKDLMLNKKLDPITRQNILGSESVKAILASNDQLALKSLARFLTTIGWPENAIVIYDTVIKLNPKSAHSYLGLGYAHGQINTRENQKQAAENLKKAIDLGLKNSENYVLLGMINYNLGRTLEAELNWKEALRIDPDNAAARDILKQLYPNGSKF